MKKALTLVELLIVLAITALFLAVSIPAFRLFQRTNQLNLSAQQVKDTIVEAKNYSLSPRKEKLDTVDNYFVYLAPDNDMSKYLVGEGDPNKPGDPVTYATVATKTLPKNIALTNSCFIKFSITKQGNIPSVDTGQCSQSLSTSGACCYGANDSNSGIHWDFLSRIMTIPVEYTRDHTHKDIEVNLSTGEINLP